jgi:hypothetical protein
VSFGVVVLYFYDVFLASLVFFWKDVGLFFNLPLQTTRWKKNESHDWEKKEKAGELSHTS